ncbi:MAG: hypothetical protein OEQ49_12365 [Myxococcales bacterium]|nr:hypothetical protein [Myxococcales bacterium]
MARYKASAARTHGTNVTTVPCHDEQQVGEDIGEAVGLHLQRALVLLVDFQEGGVALARHVVKNLDRELLTRFLKPLHALLLGSRSMMIQEGFQLFC